jgi:hypothetical protein
MRGLEFMRLESSVIHKLTDAVGELVRALPELIDQGSNYLEQLHQIQLETGLTAEQASVLVGVTKSSASRPTTWSRCSRSSARA